MPGSGHVFICCWTNRPVFVIDRMGTTTVFSEYFKSLGVDTAERYRLKIADINGEDPYAISIGEMSSDVGNCPNISYMDLVNYLVYNKSYYTSQDFKAYKSLEAYNQFACGWVRDLKWKKYGATTLIIAKVRHSQKFNDKPLVPWVIASEDGVIMSAHCTCMAGLAEACTHVGALLFFVEYAVRNRETRTVTQELAYWPVPAAKEVPYSRVQDIDFSTARKKCKVLEGSIVCTSTNTKKPKLIPSPSASEIKALNDKIFNTGAKSAFLSVTREYQEAFKPEPITSPALDLRTLHDTSHYSKTYEELIAFSNSTHIEITQQQVSKTEELTREQSNSKLWFALRGGRITASKLKAACHTRTPTSSPSLIKSICYPEQFKFKSKATEWGCTHEHVAVSQYTKQMTVDHSACVISKVGLVLNPNYPFLGASPDALVSCNCCGEGVVEIKCPFCIKDRPIEELPEKNCLELDSHGVKRLKRGHTYFYQVQAQIFLTERQYADFMVWTNVGEVFLERIYPDKTFWDAAVIKATTFFREGVLPELVGKFFTRNCDARPTSDTPTSLEHTESNSAANTTRSHWCICNGLRDTSEAMIICKNVNCEIRWYHVNCLPLKRVPKGKYLCPACKPKRVSKKRPALND